MSIKVYFLRIQMETACIAFVVIKITLVAMLMCCSR